MKTKAIFKLLIIAALFPCSAFADQFANETLRYVVTYKWGMISKDTGEATLTLRNQGPNYSILLTGRTKPWADKLFTVRDTLRATVRKTGFKPLTYEKIAHEGGKYGKDHIVYSYSGNNVAGQCTKYRDKKGEISTSEFSLHAQREAYDMLTIFYYLRNVDYNKLTPQQRIKTTIFSGSKEETITIRSLGKERIKLRDGSHRETYHIKFSFTSGGGKKSSADLDAWISTDQRHIPLQVEGSLPIGKVKCYYLGG